MKRISPSFATDGEYTVTADNNLRVQHEFLLLFKTLGMQQEGTLTHYSLVLCEVEESHVFTRLLLPHDYIL